MGTRQQQIAGTSGVGIAANLLLVAGKAVAGFLSNSVAITTDALNNLTDALSSIITLAGARAAGKAPDREHPYGHGRIEYVSATTIAALILFTAAGAMYESVRKILEPLDPDYDTLAVVVMAASMVVKLVLWRFFRARGTAADSQALVATGTDAAFDALISCAILIGAAIRTYTGVSIDGWLGVGISVVIFRSGIEILREGLSSIIGERVPAELSHQLRDEIGSFDDVHGVYDLMLHRYGPEQLIGSVYVELPADMTVREADAVCQRITRKVEEKHGIQLTVAVYASADPTGTAATIRRALMDFANADTAVLQIHGFYADLKTHSVSFHVIVDFDCRDREQIVENLLTRMRSRFPEFSFSATEDRSICD